MPEKWDCHRMDYNSHNGQHPHRHHHHNSRNQSFSSALLDAICKSTEVEGGMMAYKRSRSRVETRNVEAKNSTLMRNSRSERKWDEDSWTNNEKFMRGRSVKMGVFNAEQIEAEAVYSKHREFYLSKMSSAALCSSDYASNSSSISCPYLSSDAESLYRPTSSIRTAKTEGNSHHLGREDRTWKWAVGDPTLHGKLSVVDGHFRSSEKPLFSEDHHAKMKSRSQTGKDSEKPKQPISPGRKLANFLNSLFMAGGTKKAKLSSTSSVSDSNSYDSTERKTASVYSSSSSVQSRPCLSKTYRGSNSNSGMNQKSVTFYPSSVIVDKADSRPFGEKCLHRRENPVPNKNPRTYPHAYPSKGAYKLPQLEKENHAAAVAAKDIIGKYQQANDIMEAVVRTVDKQDEKEEDVASCASSDLFELENLADINRTMYQKELPVYGTMYQKELPVYGTTHWETNKAIAKGLIV